MPYKVTDACILCGACSAGCESNAITEGDTQAHIDINLCVECGTCERNCPSEAIIFIEEQKLESNQNTETKQIPLVELCLRQDQDERIVLP